MNKTLKALLAKFQIQLSKRNKTRKSVRKSVRKSKRKSVRKSKRMKGG